jgi:hypothetical protein
MTNATLSSAIFGLSSNIDNRIFIATSYTFGQTTWHLPDKRLFYNIAILAFDECRVRKRQKKWLLAVGLKKRKNSRRLTASGMCPLPLRRPLTLSYQTLLASGCSGYHDIAFPQTKLVPKAAKKAGVGVSSDACLGFSRSRAAARAARLRSFG